MGQLQGQVSVKLALSSDVSYSSVLLLLHSILCSRKHESTLPPFCNGANYQICLRGGQESEQHSGSMLGQEVLWCNSKKVATTDLAQKVICRLE